MSAECEICLQQGSFFLADFVVDHDLDILCLTETWLSCEDTVSATAVTHSNVLLGETVVAVVLVYFSELHTLSITQHFGPLPHLNASTYNYVLQGSLPRTLRLFVIYRPPSSSRNSQPFATFLTEFRELVECVGTKSGIIIVGDFNVRYGDDSDPHARALRDVLSDANLRQNVTDATHNRGNVLDLVITASSSSLVTGVSVNNLVTDHFAVICDLATTKPRPPRKTITYRRYAAIDNSSFTTDLSECNVITQPLGDVCSLYDQYCSELSCLIVHHAPLVQRTVNERPHTPWWCRKLDDMKRRVRLSERKWRQNRTDNYCNCYIELRDQYCRTLASTKAAFYSKVIETASNDTRAMFRITNRLLGRKCGNTLPNEMVALLFLPVVSRVTSPTRSTRSAAKSRCHQRTSITRMHVLFCRHCWHFCRLRSKK